jgi:TPR repeat protein
MGSEKDEYFGKEDIAKGGSVNWKRLIMMSMAVFISAIMVLPALADFKAGMNAYKKKDYVTAMREFRSDGKAKANFNIGIMYYKGEGVKQDKKEAAKWLLKSAEQGYGQAQFVLSVMYFTGDGIESNIPDAVKWIHKSAGNGFAEAQFRLGMMYINGDNVEKNKEQGVRWVKKAAKQGHMNAKKLLKVMGES